MGRIESENVQWRQMDKDARKDTNPAEHCEIDKIARTKVAGRLVNVGYIHFE